MKIVKRYYRAIYRCLPLTRKKKKQYLSGMMNSLKEYAEEKPEVTYEELVKVFGTPNSVAAGIMEISEEDIKQVIKQRSNKNRIYLGVIVVMLVACISLSYLLVKKYKSKIIYVQSEIQEYESWPFAEGENETTADK